MTVPIGWTSSGVLTFELPLPNVSHGAPGWPRTVAIVVDPACLVVDPETACSLHKTVLLKAIDDIVGIRLVFDSVFGRTGLDRHGNKLTIIQANIERTKRTKLVIAHKMSDIRRAVGAPHDLQEYEPIRRKGAWDAK